MDTPEKRVWGEKLPKDDDLQIILVLTRPKTFTQGHGNVFDKYLHWPQVSVKTIYIHCNRISVSVKHLDV